MSSNPDSAGLIRCPRCRSRIIAVAGDDLGSADPRRALSRTTRDDGAEIDVCSHCGSLEADADAAGDLAPITDWPLSPDRLAAEERRWYAGMQAGVFRDMEVTPDDAKRILGQSDDDDATEPDFVLIHAAIEQHAKQQALDMAETASELSHFAASAQALAILAVMTLAEERSVSVEAVLRELTSTEP